MKSSFGCLLILGLLVVLAFVAFIVGSSLLARAEDAFGPPAAGLGNLQRLRLGLGLGFRADALLRPVDENAGQVRLSIELNEPTAHIVNEMKEAGLLRDSDLFSSYLTYSGLDTQLQAGLYMLSPSMNAVELAAVFLDPTPETVTLVILPGWRLEETAAALPAAGVNVTPDEFLLAAWDPPEGLLLPFDLPEGASLEGYIRPGSYEIDRDANAINLLTMLTLEFSNGLVDLVSGFDQRGLSLHEGVILASIVERESVIEGEMPRIASVFLNRLQAGIKLEADPTVQYALGYDPASASWWKTPLTSADLTVGSEYNTYIVVGLPPGPIAAPSFEALTAVAYPEETSFFFFQAACDGSGHHAFAVSYEEHIANNCQ